MRSPLSMKTRLVFLRAILLLGCALWSGGISIPPVPKEQTSLTESLRAHVEFLAQPSLKGRAPRSRGSKAAQRYVESRFAAYGLRPWAQARSFEQSFGYGCNVVGVLPGSDPKLSEEIVLVCAHYDHLGREQGKVHPGAADNAAGVAALLEVAQQISHIQPRPKRTVAFAAFDCEEWMLFGSFAFALQGNVRSAKIVAVVNADMLGRSFMDAVGQTLF